MMKTLWHLSLLFWGMKSHFSELKMWNKQKINMIILGDIYSEIYSTIWLYLFNVKTLSNCWNLGISLTRKNTPTTTMSWDQDWKTQNFCCVLDVFFPTLWLHSFNISILFYDKILPIFLNLPSWKKSIFSDHKLIFILWR